MNLKRVRILKESKSKTGPVVYWMQRDQRAHDNWAIIYAQNLAIERRVPLYVVFNLVPDFLDATKRQYGFMLKGLEETETELKTFNISFQLTTGDPSVSLPIFLTDFNAGLIVTDFNPLKIIQRWKKNIAGKIDIPFHEVDAHNIVPCFAASDKVEFGARTLRPKIHKLLPEFLDMFPALKEMKALLNTTYNTDWNSVRRILKINSNVSEVDWLKPGEIAAHRVLENFISNKLKNYSLKRNDPTLDNVSNLSPYFHFGHIAPQRVALAIQPITEYYESQKAFLEEMIIRRELSDNFCFFNKNYDSFEGFHTWAKESLNAHRKDKRENFYSTLQFEHSETHDALWNAAQREMVIKGKMHGYMRMYWAKKILEWTPSPEAAMKIAIYLNDKYELDGRDPNGYAGIAWSIGGVHDRPWFEREVYGKIRYMNYNGSAKKFDVDKYIQQMKSLELKSAE